MWFNKRIVQPSAIEVLASPIHGRGVFAKKKLYRGSLIEEAPVVFLSEEDTSVLRYTKLFNYYFLLGKKANPAAFGFGYASFYNHSARANAVYTFSERKGLLTVYAYRTIEAGTEVTINYNGHPDDEAAVYFPEQAI